MKDIHDRMPVILYPEDEGSWLSEEDSLDKIGDLVAPFNPNNMVAYKISSMVNSPLNDKLDIINPL